MKNIWSFCFLFNNLANNLTGCLNLKKNEAVAQKEWM